ncbi:hypothetical protein LINPERPRIM_LOCUS29543 [Linum perenne]
MTSRNYTGCRGKECVCQKIKEALDLQILKLLIKFYSQDMLGEFLRSLIPSLLEYLKEDISLKIHLWKLH